MNIEHKHDEKRGMFFYQEEGKVLAEMAYVMAGPSKMIIEHTEVNESLEGKGVGKKLLETLVNYVRKENIRVVPLCPFAKATFTRVKEWQDVLSTPLS